MTSKTGCCWYSVRSYVKAGADGAGETNWVANYWSGSTNSFVPGFLGPVDVASSSPLYPDYLQVAVDPAGDVYVSGPRATSYDGMTHWNLIKYEGATGAVIYRADVQPLGSTGNIWSILYFSDDDKIWVLGDALPGGGAPYARVNPMNGDFIDGIGAVSGGSLKLKESESAGSPIVQVTPYPIDNGGGNGNPRYQTIVGDKVGSIGVPANPADTGPILTVQTLPIGSTSTPYRMYRVQGFDAYPYSGVRALDMIAGGTELLLAASTVLMHFSDAPPDSGGLALFDTGLDAFFFPAGTYPLTYRWKRPTGDTKSFLKFQDADYLATYGAPPTSTMVLANVDGAKVFAHFHQPVTDIAFSDDAMITVGFRKQKSGDIDFT